MLACVSAIARRRSPVSAVGDRLLYWSTTYASSWSRSAPFSSSSSLQNSSSSPSHATARPTLSAEYHSRLTVGLPFEIRQLPSAKGRGCFATRDIAENELVLLESPLIVAADPQREVISHCDATLQPIETSWLADPEDLPPGVDESTLREQIHASSPPGLFPAPSDPYPCRGDCQCSHRVCFASRDVFDQAFGEYHQLLCPRYLQEHHPERVEPLQEMQDAFLSSKSMSKNAMTNLLLKLLAALELNTMTRHGYTIRDHISHLESRIAYPSRDDHLAAEIFVELHLAVFRVLFPGLCSTWLKDSKSIHNLIGVITANSFSVESQTPEFSLETADGAHSLSFDINDENRLPGSGVFLIASYFNHCCDYTLVNLLMAEPSFNGARTAFVARRDIKKGEELLISYLAASSQELAKELVQREFGFDCLDTCAHCDSSEPDGSTEPK